MRMIFSVGVAGWRRTNFETWD